ncbi:sulfotransferase 1E1-like [Glandiceps talaboti]
MDEKDTIAITWPIEKLEKIQIRHDDVIASTYPKSGTHWIKHIMKLLLNNGNVGDSIPEETRGGNLESIVADEDHDLNLSRLKIVGHPDICVNLEKMTSPRFLMTHIPIDWFPSLSNAKVIYLARNPKDVLVSWYDLGLLLDTERSPEKNREIFDQTVDGFITGTLPMGLGLWHEHVLPWWKRRNEENVLFLKYEDMKRDLRTSVQKIAEFIGKSPSPELIDKIVHLTTFETMKKNPPPDHEFVAEAFELKVKPGESALLKTGKVGRWKDHFTVAQNEYFDDNYKNWMEGSGLDFDFE